MKDFAALLERLAFTGARNGKIAHLQHYLQTAQDPDRGWALAAITGELTLRNVSPSLLRKLIGERVDPQLFALSYDFVGDLAETIALLWPEPTTYSDMPLSQAIAVLQATGRKGTEIAAVLDQLPKDERLAFLKLATGNLRLGMSARLARVALSGLGAVEISQIEEIWHGLTPPYEDLFHWLAGGDLPQNHAKAPFRPVMLSTPTTLDELSALPPERYMAEWKWDGIRVQAVADGDTRRLYSRTGDDISQAFPDVIEMMDFEGVLDGELLVAHNGEIAAFGELQRRLGRKTVTRALCEELPAHLRLYDLLSWQGEDFRPEPLSLRRAKLENLHLPHAAIDLSPRLDFASWDDLAALRAAPPSVVIEGVMIKDLNSAYVGGRPRGPWFKWKRDAMRLDAVLLYAQSGHGKRSGFYSDFTFGLWHDGDLVPVGKAYFGFTDEELRELDRFVRKNTTQRFGPVRQVAPELVLEVAFEGVNRSARHKAGLAMRFPRIARIRWDKPAAEADHLSALEALL